MNDIAISVKNLSKSYKMYSTPKERLKELLHPFGKKYHKDFWALKDVSFEVPQGTTLGLVGQNGSGKSTLLQLICGILQPTEGEVKVQGRISALLELGAGFNMDFTGRENVYMNGALRGFKREEMDERVDRIANFADIGDFIDQPVKTYSSGMYVRLAFACAVNIDPDILIVDEALAVGDIKFQRKCYAKFAEFKEKKKTILFVTHNLETINLYCDNAFLINKGGLIEKGEPKRITRIYQQMMIGEIPVKLEGKTNIEAENKDKQDIQKIKTFADEKLKVHKAGKKAEIIDYGILDKYGNNVVLVETGAKYTAFSRVLIYEPLNVLHLGYPIRTLKGMFLFGNNKVTQETNIKPLVPGEIIEGRLELTMWLAPGNYFISFRSGVWISDWEQVYDEVPDVHFVVAADNRISTSSIINLEPNLTIRNI